MWGGLENILNTKPTGESYYEILGCSEKSSVEQIITEYKLRALKLHPDKNPTNQTLEEFQKLQEARDTLTDPEKRKMYDLWRQCSLGLTFQQWKSVHSRCQMTMHWATPKTGTMLEDANGKSSEQCATASTSEDEKQIGDIRWGQQCTQWKPENRNRLYSKFRNYEI